MKQHAKMILLLALISLVAGWCTASVAEQELGPWEKREIEEGVVSETNYSRRILDEKGREIRAQLGSGTTPYNVVLRYDSIYRYEETEEGLVRWTEARQYDAHGSLELLMMSKDLNDVPMGSEWFDAAGRRVQWQEVDPESGHKHSLYAHKWPNDQGVIVLKISEAYLDREGNNLSQVIFHYNDAGELIYQEHYVRNVEENSFRREPYDGVPSEYIEAMARDWFSK